MHLKLSSVKCCPTGVRLAITAGDNLLTVRAIGVLTAGTTCTEPLFDDVTLLDGRCEGPDLEGDVDASSHEITGGV